MKKVKTTTVIFLAVLILGTAVLAINYYSGIAKEQGTALLKALKKGELAKFKKLLESGANPNSVFGRNDWVMGMTTEKGKIAYLKLAVEHGGDVNLNNPHSSYNRPIFSALLNNNDEAVKYLIEKGADLETRHCPKCAIDLQYSPASMAAGFNEYALVSYMIKKKGGLNPLETKQIIFVIEHHLIVIKSEANQWRMKVAEYLRSQGHTVKPKMHSQFEKNQNE